MKHGILFLSLSLLLVASCLNFGEEPTGLALSEPRQGDGRGPFVVFDPLRLPDPEIPFPNDFAARYAPDSPTGLRLNVSTMVPTKSEEQTRKHMNELDGFGLLAPISVSFTGKIDLKTVTDTSVFLINVDRNSKYFGEVMPLDLGKGNYPSLMEKVNYFPNDPKSEYTNFLFEKDNLFDLDGDGSEEFIDFYEFETNTLLIRPIVPMHEGCKYAVYITRDVKGFAGSDAYGSIRSPFRFVNHVSQTKDLENGLEVLKKYGVQRDEIAFAWSFTTQAPMKFYETLRNGLRGSGPLARLATEFPPVLSEIHSTGIPFDGDGSHPDFPYVERDNIITLQGKYFEVLIDFFAPFFGGENVNYSFEDVDYIVFGKFESPDFRKATEDNVFDIDINTGGAKYVKGKIPFMITVPKTTEKRKPPFPVIMYAHGNATSRFEALLLAQAVARFGFAIFAIDAVGHGPLLPLQLKEWLERELEEEGNNLGGMSLDDLVDFIALFVEAYLIPPDQDLESDIDFDELLTLLRGDEKGEGGIGIFKELAFWGRSEDENRDGIAENGEAFFVAQPFRQRDCIRQTMIDYLQAIRIIQAFDQSKVPPKVENAKDATFEELVPNALTGDFNADGILDIGGKENPVYMAGTSLGGIHTSLVGSIEPDIKAIVPLVAGGGLTDLFLRSTLRERFESAFLYNLGPLVIGCASDGKVYLSFNNDTKNCNRNLLEKVSFGVVSFEASATVVLENLNNGETVEVETDSLGNFSAAVASDRNDKILIRIFDKLGKEVGSEAFTALNPEKFAFNPVEMTVTTPYEGVALKRNTPRFRRFVGFMQVIMDQVDPGVMLRYLMLEPPDGLPPRNILQIAVLKDKTLPISGQVLMARVVGNLGLTQEVWMPLNNILNEKGVLIGSDYDVDDLDKNNNGIGPLPVIRTGETVSAVRFANVDGWHEYMAVPDPSKPFDHATYTHNQIALYFASGAREVVDDVCINKNNVEDCAPLKRYK